MMTQRAQLDKFRIFRKRIAGLDIFPQDRQIRLQIFGKQTTQNNVAVQNHMDAVYGNGEMSKHVVEKRLISGIVKLDAMEKLLQGYTELVFNALGIDIRFQTAVLSAIAEQTARLNTEMAELTALSIVAGVRVSADDNGSADPVFQRKVSKIGGVAADKKLCKAAGGSVVFNVDGIRDISCQNLQRNILQIERRSHVNSRVILCDQCRNR